MMGGALNAIASPPEVRGTWLTTTGPDHIRTGLNTEPVMINLDNIGVNTVYVESWKNGYTNFPSSTLFNLIGVDRTPTLGARDLVQETLIHAHRRNHIYVSWFEYGFSSQFIGTGGTPNNPLSQYMLKQQSSINGQTVQGWLLQDQQGRYGNASSGFAWMNPAVPEVRQLLIDLTLDAVRKYDIDGVQLDDRLAWPREFGWDATTAAYYFAETGRNLPTSLNDVNFRAWRQSKVRLFATELYNALKAEDPNLLVSVSPSVIGFSDTQYNAAWGEWVASGLFDEYVPQVYRSTIASFQSDLPANVAPFVSAGRQDDMVVGIRFNGSGGDTPLADVQQMITTVRNSAGGLLSGHSTWYSSGMITNQAAMTSFYNDAVNGPAGHPKFGFDYRPAPIVAESMGGSAWRVDVPSPANYRLAARIGTFWKEIGLDFYAPGMHEILVPGATAVELLLARRLTPDPITNGDFSDDGRLDCVDIDQLVQTIAAGWLNLALDVTLDGLINLADLDRWLQLAGAANLPSGNAYRRGDANLDGVVDGTDFGIWNANKFTAQAAWCRGDFTADGFVDGSDFNLWNANKFTTADTLLHIPEPRSVVVVALMAIWVRITWKRHRSR